MKKNIVITGIIFSAFLIDIIMAFEAISLYYIVAIDFVAFCLFIMIKIKSK